MHTLAKELGQQHIAMCTVLEVKKGLSIVHHKDILVATLGMQE